MGVPLAGSSRYGVGPSWIGTKASLGKEFLETYPNICKGFEKGFVRLTFRNKLFGMRDCPFWQGAFWNDWFSVI